MIIMLIIFIGSIQANLSRMNVLMVGDYIDDPVNIEIFPQHLVIFQNYLYGDILKGTEDYGIIIAPEAKYGCMGIKQNGIISLGYGINLHKFDIGILGSWIEGHRHFGLGLGRVFFASRVDISFIVNNEKYLNEGYGSNFRFLLRKGDYILIPRYSFYNSSEMYDYISNRIGMMLQRYILNEGFVFFLFEYTLNNGEIKTDFIRVFSGLELPLNKTFVLRLGTEGEFDQDFVSIQKKLETGLGLHIREFNIDFHLNKERFFNKELTFFNSLGLDLNFGKF